MPFKVDLVLRCDDCGALNVAPVTDLAELQTPGAIIKRFGWTLAHDRRVFCSDRCAEDAAKKEAAAKAAAEKAEAANANP